MLRIKTIQANSKRLSRGAATTEFFVFGLAMVPIFTLLPTMARVADLNQSSAQASRYGAWERTVSNKSEAELGNEIAGRLLASPDAAIQSDQPAVGEADGDQNFFWRGGGGQRLFDATGGNIGVTLASNDLPNVPGALGDMVDALGSTIGALVSDASWDLGAGGLYTASVSLTTRDDGVLGQQEGSVTCNTAAITTNNGNDNTGNDIANDYGLACLRARNAILVDSWSARDRDHVEERVRSLVPAGILRPLGELLGGDFALPVFQELGGLEDAFGHVDADELPADRVGDGN